VHRTQGASREDRVEPEGVTVSVLIAGSDTRIVELRAVGTRATSAESAVDAVAGVDVVGDGAGRFVRPADRLRRPAPVRTVAPAPSHLWWRNSHTCRDRRGRA
jgi:hypothetical protein